MIKSEGELLEARRLLAKLKYHFTHTETKYPVFRRSLEWMSRNQSETSLTTVFGFLILKNLHLIIGYDEETATKKSQELKIKDIEEFIELVEEYLK